MKLINLINKLRDESEKSVITNKHACVAVIGNKAVSPFFHNYMRYQVFGFNCGSCHAEMVTINYLLNTLCRGSYRKKQSCIYKLFNSMKLTKNEENFIKKMIKKLSKISLIVIKQSNTTGSLGVSKPCNACIKAMKALKLKKVYYSNADGNIVLEKINNISSTHKSRMFKYMNT